MLWVQDEENGEGEDVNNPTKTNKGITQSTDVNNPTKTHKISHNQLWPVTFGGTLRHTTMRIATADQPSANHDRNWIRRVDCKMQQGSQVRQCSSCKCAHGVDWSPLPSPILPLPHPTTHQPRTTRLGVFTHVMGDIVTTNQAPQQLRDTISHRGRARQCRQLMSPVSAVAPACRRLHPLAPPVTPVHTVC